MTIDPYTRSVPQTPAPSQQVGRQVSDLDIKRVAEALGLPVRGNRFQVAWRNGDSWSGQLNQSIGSWTDHNAGDKGGIIALVEKALGCDRNAARAWLEENFDLAPLVERTAEERRAYAARRAKIRAIAEELVRKRDALLRAIQDRERKHLEEYHRLERIAHAEQCIETLIRADKEFAAIEELTAMRDRICDAEGLDLIRLLQKNEAA